VGDPISAALWIGDRRPQWVVTAARRSEADDPSDDGEHVRELCDR
jgi:hypothetical protein